MKEACKDCDFLNSCEDKHDDNYDCDLSEDNMRELREVSKMLLHIPYEVNKEFPLFVIHPYFNSLVVMLDGELVNIGEDERAIEKYYAQMEKIIDSCKTPVELMSLLQSQYAMTWLKYAKPHLSHDDFSELIGIAWVNCENANMDANVPIRESAKWFKLANKMKLMDEEEYAVYEAIPETITLYRGVSEGRKEKGMSWTADKEKARWFMNRFGEGYMLEMTVKKKDVLAYFSRRNEDEYLVYPKDYRRVEL